MEKVRVYFKDCEDMSELRDGEVDLTWTSPPYWIMRGECPEYIDYDEWKDKMFRCFREVYRVTGDGRFCVVNVGNYIYEGEIYPVAFDIVDVVRKAGFRFVDEIVWYKNTHYAKGRGFNMKGVGKVGCVYHDMCFEYVFVFSKGKPEIRDCDIPRGYDSKNLWTVTSDVGCFRHCDSEGKQHPASFGMKLSERVIGLYSCKGDVVLDPFCGSGTTLEAALKMGRRAVGYEKYRVSPVSKVNYEEIIMKRIDKYVNNRSIEEFIRM